MAARTLRLLLACAVVAAGVVAASGDLFAQLIVLAYGAIGGLLAVLRPRNPVGWLLVWIGWGVVGMTRSGGLDLVALEQGRAVFRDAAWAWFEGWAGQGVFLGFVLLLMLYPEGRLPSRHPWSRLLIAGAALATVVPAVAPTVSVGVDAVTFQSVRNPLGLLPDVRWLRFVTSAAGDIYLPIVLLAIAVGVTVVRHRVARGPLRLQLRWLLAAIASVGVAVAGGALALAVVGDRFGDVVWIPAVVAFPTVPVAVAIAVLRFRLYDIDLVVRRTVTYAALTVLLGTLYTVAVVVLQRVVRLATGQRSDVAVVASTLLVAALFGPLLRRVRGAVDRRFHRTRFDAEGALRVLSDALRSEVVPERISGAVLGVLERSLQPDALSLWLREAGTSRDGAETVRRDAASMGRGAPP